MKKLYIAAIGIVFSGFSFGQDISTLTNISQVYTNNGFGSAKYQSMAGSMGALGGDLSSAINNPAALGVSLQGEITGTVGFGDYKNETTLGKNIQNYKNNDSNLDHFGASIVFHNHSSNKWRNFGIGINTSTVDLDSYVESNGLSSGISIKKNLLNSNNQPVVGNLTLNKHAYERVGSKNNTQLAFGANYDHKIYVGAGLNFISSQLTNSDVASFNLNLDNNNYTFQKQFTPFSEDASGFNGSVGIIAKTGTDFRLGLSLSSPTVYSIERVYTEYYDDANGYIESENLSESRKIRTPGNLNLSAAYVPNKSFSVNVDYQMEYSNPKITSDGDAAQEFNSFMEQYYSGKKTIRVGGEYRIDNFRLRGGYSKTFGSFKDISIESPTTQNFSNLLTGDTQLFAGGLGYDFGRMSLDVAYQNSQTEYNNPFLYGKDFGNYRSGYFSGDFDVTNNSFAVSAVKNTTNRFFITLGYRF